MTLVRDKRGDLTLPIATRRPHRARRGHGRVLGERYTLFAQTRTSLRELDLLSHVGGKIDAVETGPARRLARTRELTHPS